MSIPLFRPLDRYVLGSFFRTFAVTALGFPLLVIAIDCTEKLSRYIDRALPAKSIILAYVYFVPECMVMVLPASVLFATVFTIGSLTRHSEIAAAKASGISFYRIIAPLAIGAVFATGVGLVISELVPVGTARRNVILGEKSSRGDDMRTGFAYAADGGRVYSIGELDARGKGRLSRLEIERWGTGPDYPTVVTMASDGDWQPNARWWHLRDGVIQILPTDSTEIAFHFAGLRDFHMTESPRDLLQKSTQPDEMQRAELQRYIVAMQRSGMNVAGTRVDLMLRIAIPATCVIIFFFGAPLATSNQRGGAAFGMGIALGTTILFLMLVQLTRAIGGNGFISPELAAWIPSLVFGAAGVVLLARVRT